MPTIPIWTYLNISEYLSYPTYLAISLIICLIIPLQHPLPQKTKRWADTVETVLTPARQPQSSDSTSESGHRPRCFTTMAQRLVAAVSEVHVGDVGCILLNMVVAGPIMNNCKFLAHALH